LRIHLHDTIDAIVASVVDYYGMFAIISAPVDSPRGYGFSS
jgi:hypothetical protein